jgi:hypothetical protein
MGQKLANSQSGVVLKRRKLALTKERYDEAGRC